MKLQFRIADLMIFVILSAAISYTYRYDRDTLAVVCWAFFMASLGVATVVAWLGSGARARFSQGFVLFGWPWLACGLRFGLLPTNNHLLLHTAIGLGFAMLSGYAVCRLIPQLNLKGTVR